MTAHFIGKESFTSPMVLEGSWGERDVGTHDSTMELYFREDATGFIEWDIPDLEDFYEIGLWFTIDQFGIRCLSDYDGVMCLSDKAIEMLRKYDVIVPKDFE
jgi:hypothetical protein